MSLRISPFGTSDLAPVTVNGPNVPFPHRSISSAVGSAPEMPGPHADGNGFNIQIDTAPLDGRLSLRVPSERKD